MIPRKEPDEVPRIRLVWSRPEPDTTEYEELDEPYVEKWPLWVRAFVILAIVAMGFAFSWFLGGWFVSEGTKFLAPYWPHYPH